MASAANNYLSVVKLLIEQGKVDIHAKRNNDNTALHWAANNGHSQIVSYLLDHGAQINMRGSRGRTPLYLAGAI